MQIIVADLKGGLLAKSRKLFFCSLGHTDHLYTYKGHIDHVGFTLILQSPEIQQLL